MWFRAENAQGGCIQAERLRGEKEERDGDRQGGKKETEKAADPEKSKVEGGGGAAATYDEIGRRGESLSFFCLIFQSI